MKLLNYSDMIFYKENGISISGACCVHLPYGPVPENFDILLGTMAVDHIAHIEIIYDNGYEKHQVIPEEEMPEGVLTEEELAVQERIYRKFANFSSVDISNYSHKEKGYNATQKGEIISYAYAKDIHLKVVWSLFIPAIAIQVYTVLDKTMIGFIADSAFENRYYEQAIKISKMLLSLVTALGAVMAPRIGYLFENGSKKEIQMYMYRGYRFVWFMGIPMCFGIILIAGNFVPWFFGSGYDKVVPLLQILSLLIPVIGISNVTGAQYLIPTKKQRIFTFSVVAGAVINFCLNMVLIYLFQSL